MSAHSRTLRRSDAVQPYGPGAILDHGQECFVVMDTSQRNVGWTSSPDNRIRLKRLERQLGAHDGFRLAPTEKSYSPGILVTRFPRWLFCPVCGMMVRWTRDDESDLKGGSPKCRSQNCQAKDIILVPMRYVAACSDGHLTDVRKFEN